MTKRSKKALDDDLTNDGKTVEINTIDVGPLLALELTGIENKRENQITSSNIDASSPKEPSSFPLLGTSHY